MDTATIDPKAEEALNDLQKRMDGKTPVEKLSMLKAFAAEQGVQGETRGAPIIQFTDEQFKSWMKDGLDGAKKAVSQTTDAIQRKYSLPVGDAKAIAEGAVTDEMGRKQRKFEDCKVAANVFKQIAHATRGNAKPGALEKAYDDEREYLTKTNRAASYEMTTDYADAGYLAPQIWNTMLYENLARTSLLRKFGYWFPMESNYMQLPKLTAGVTANTTSEAGANTTSKPTVDKATWSLKKLTVTTAPFSIELLENARPELIQLLTGLATIELNRKEDEVCFKTNDSGWANLLGITTRDVTATGATGYSSVTFDHMTDLKYKLAEQYIPDEDVSGSGIIGGQAQYWVNQKLVQALLELKGAVAGSTVGYLWQPVQQLAENMNIRGNRVRRVLSAPASPSAGDRVAVFGNLNYVWVGYKPGFIIDILKEGTVKDTNGSDVNLAMTSQYALRVNELVSAQCVDENAFAVLKLDSSGQ